MTDPLPSSPIVPGRTTTGGPLLHLTVAVAPMRTATMTTAGLARNTADWSSASVAAAETAGRLVTRRQTIAVTTRGLAALLIVLFIAPPSGTLPRGLGVRHSDASQRAPSGRGAPLYRSLWAPAQSIGRRTIRWLEARQQDRIGPSMRAGPRVGDSPRRSLPAGTGRCGVATASLSVVARSERRHEPKCDHHQHCQAPDREPPPLTLALGCSTVVTTMTNSRRPAGRRPGAGVPAAPGVEPRRRDRPTQAAVRAHLPPPPQRRTTRTSRAVTGVKGPDTRNER